MTLTEKISHSAGYSVEIAQGRVGIVAEVGYSPSARWDHPDALVVRLGRSGSRLITIAASEVRDVIPAERKVVLANAFAFADATVRSERHLQTVAG
jgi:hypothetical protein